MSLSELSIVEAGRRFRDGSLSPVALTRHCLDRIRDEDTALCSFNTVASERALTAAAQAERELKAGRDRGPMHGIPYAAKDVIDTEGVLTSCQSRLLADNLPAADAHVVARLTKAGAVLLGKTATFEFATGGPGTDTLFPPARNPWDRNRVPGGSSSGSAAAVSAGFARVALGTDSGGSIRVPAALCGTVGMKATFGRVSRRGIFPLAYSLDHCGLLAWTVEDAAIALQTIAGFDPLDPVSADVPVPDYSAALRRGGTSLRIAVGTNWLRQPNGASAETIAALEAAVGIFAKAGIETEKVDIPDWQDFVAVCRVILLAESYAAHAQDLAQRGDLYGNRARVRLSTGAFISAADYINAQRLRRRLAKRINEGVLSTYDVLIVPTTMSPATRFDELDEDPNSVPEVTTLPFSLSGNPAMSVCCGFTHDGLPLAMQLVGRYFDEAALFEAASVYAAATGWSERRPKMTGTP